MKASNIIAIGAAGVAAYLIWKFFGQIKEKVQAGADAIAAPIANTYIKLTMPEPVGVSGAAILPNGAAISMSKLYVQKVPNKEIFYFDYSGKRYQLGLRTPNGNWPAQVMM